MTKNLTIITFFIGAILGSLFGWQVVIILALMALLFLLMFYLGYYILPENPNNN